MWTPDGVDALPITHHLPTGNPFGKLRAARFHKAEWGALLASFYTGNT